MGHPIKSQTEEKGKGQASSLSGEKEIKLVADIWLNANTPKLYIKRALGFPCQPYELFPLGVPFCYLLLMHYLFTTYQLTELSGSRITR